MDIRTTRRILGEDRSWERRRSARRACCDRHDLRRREPARRTRRSPSRRPRTQVRGPDDVAKVSRRRAERGASSLEVAYNFRTTARVASRQRGAHQPRPMKVMTAIERCRTVRSAAIRRAARTERAGTPSSATTAAATGIVLSAKGQRHASGWPSARPSCSLFRTSMSCTRCRRRSPTSPTPTRR